MIYCAPIFAHAENTGNDCRSQCISSFTADSLLAKLMSGEIDVSAIQL